MSPEPHIGAFLWEVNLMSFHVCVKCPKGHYIIYDYKGEVEIDFGEDRLRYYCSVCEVTYSVSLSKTLEEKRGEK